MKPQTVDQWREEHGLGVQPPEPSLFDQPAAFELTSQTEREMQEEESGRFLKWVQEAVTEGGEHG